MQAIWFTLALLGCAHANPFEKGPIGGVVEMAQRTLFSQPPDANAAPEPMMIIGAGLGRTGTASLQLALQTLGYAVQKRRAPRVYRPPIR